LICLAAACGDDDKPTKPKVVDLPVVSQQQAGIWSLSSLVRDCHTNVVFDQTVLIDTLQAGETWFELQDLDCEATLSGDKYRVVCSSEEEAGEGCTVTLHIDFSFTLTAASCSMNGTESISATPTGCIGSADRCFRVAVLGTRTSGLP
jgi:hypothetical protein